MSNVIDYRISRIVILCKDCDQDVGLYPARHKCGIPSSEAPPLPSIPKKYLSAGKTGTDIQSDDDSSESLWGKLRSIRNWNDPNVETVEDVTDNSQNSRLWNKMNKILALSNNADYDSDNESEKDEWEGETHISRILREYYENKGVDLPDWLYDLDSKTSDSSTQMLNDNDNKSKKSDNNIGRSLQPRIYDSRETSNLNNTTNNDNNNKPDNNISRSLQPRIYDSKRISNLNNSINNDNNNKMSASNTKSDNNISRGLQPRIYDSRETSNLNNTANNNNNNKSDNNISRGLQPRIYDSRETSNLNNTANNNNNKSVSRGRQPRIYDSRELLTSPTSMNYPPLPIKSKDRSRDRSRDRNVHPPNLYNDQYRNNIPATSKTFDPRYNNRSINNSLPPRPSPNIRSTSNDDRRLTYKKKSHQQLRTVHNPPHIPTNRARSVSPNPPRSHQYQQFIPHDVRRFNNNISQYNDGRSRQGVPPSGLHDRNNRQRDLF